jgi:putative ATPase
MSGVPTVLFIDEVHRFTRTQQDALLPGVENGWVTLVAATTENPSFSVVSPLLSRSLLLTLRPLTDDELGTLLDRAVADERGLAGRVRLSPGARADLIRYSGGDARRALTYLEAAAQDPQPVTAESPGDPVAGALAGDEQLPEVTAEQVAVAVQRALVRYDRTGDQHYDVISAFIKSVRGSDVDAALHYLARMIEAGEDPRFIARRLVILASEDIGLADPSALSVATAAMTSSAQIGLPEARLPLAQATIHLALAPKSNAVIRAIDAAQADVRAGLVGQVPPHLRDGHYPNAAALGVTGYRYPHDDPTGVVAQQYAPDPVRGRRYYEPEGHGAEARLADVLARLRRAVGSPPADPERPPGG